MVVLTDKNFRENLFPFTHTRHAADIRIGMLTIREKWERLLGEKVSTNENDEGIHIPASIIPTLHNFHQILEAAEKNVFLMETESIKIISFPWHIFQLNEFALKHDFEMLTKGKKSATINDTNKAISPENIFIEEGAIVNHCILNASFGPIFISKNAEIMEGAFIRGAFYLGENSVVKMGAKIYGATTIGPNCVVAGEIKNSILFGNSNKAHDGYLGDSVIGEWCNLGAGTSNSNVKNSGGNIGYVLEKDTQAIFAGNKAGLLMGDYSRAAINTAFNTGTVVGVCCNIFGEVMPPKFSDNFTWGTEKYIFEKAIEDIDNWMKFKNQGIDAKTVKMLEKLYGNA
jgi:UDP-N-acetylglucosamine diphosphorylase / glucose-1-phosphate thymidylyltransferase / UDP-N-acetylgalactosamine diphosphorylase / glucosamine-1-phosphate N-acetyltransferase / galactosamine-1-phosphate N-acetyltransferase